MKALIHIGMQKAGSSSLQAFLAANRAALSERGFRYAPLLPAFGSQYELPVTALHLAGRLPEDAHAAATLGLRGPGDAQALADRFAAALQEGRARWSGPVFLASSEHLHAWLRDPAPIAALDRFLRGHFAEVRYVLWLRPFCAYLLSSHAEAVRRGAVHDLDAHLTRELSETNYRRSVRLWSGAVGEDRLDVRLLAPDAMAGGDLIEDYCAWAGIPGAGLLRPPRMNTAPGAPELALRRRINALLPVFDARGRRALPHRLAVALAVRLARLWPQGARPGLDARQLAQAEAAARGWHRRLQADLFPRRAVLFPGDPVAEAAARPPEGQGTGAGASAG